MANIILRVVFEGTTYDLDIQSDIPLRLDVSAIENDRLGSFFGVGSQTFDLPGTKKNNKFFKHAYEIGATDIPAFYNTIQAYVIYDGETLIQGQLLLLEALTDQEGYVTYKVQISDQVVQFKDAIANKLIAEGDWSAYTHTLTSASIVDSWSGNLLSGSVFYPLCDFGSDSKADWPNIPRVATGTTPGYITTGSTPMQAKQFLPAIRVKDTLDVLFDQVGFTYTGSFVTGSSWENLYILPKATEGLGAGDAQFNGLEGVGGTVMPQMTSGTTYVLNVQAYSDPGGNFNNSTNTYTVPVSGDYTMSATFTYIVNPVQAGNTPVQFELQFYRNGSPIGVYDVEQLNYLDAPITQTLPAQTYALTAGDLITCRLTAFYSGTQLQSFPFRSTWSLPNSSAPTTYEGTTVNMANQWDAQTKSLDILKGLIEQFNLVLTPVYNENNKISIDTFDQWMLQGRFIDWTDKFQTAERVGIRHTVSEQQREIKLANVEDSDRFSKVAQEDTPNFQYGTLRLLSQNNISQGDKNIGTLFAPTVLGSEIQSGSVDEQGNPTFNLNLASSFVFPHLYKFENAEQKAYKFKPRIGYKATNTLPVPIYIGLPVENIEVTGQYATLSNVSEIPSVTGSTLDLHFNNTYVPFTGGVNVVSGKTAYTQYWKTYIDSLYWDESKKVTLDIKFNQQEYKDIRLNDKIFIKDQLYRINKISGFNISNKDVATVELIRLYPAYYTAPEVPVGPTTTTTTSTTTTSTTSTTSTSTTTTSTTVPTTTTTTTSTSTTTSTTTVPTTTTTTSTSTTTTTTTFSCNCYSYYIENYDLSQTLTFQYQDCSGSIIQDNVVLPDTTTPSFCACSGSVQRQGGSLAYDIILDWEGCGPEPTTTTTTSTTTTLDPLGCYEWEVECLTPGGCLVQYTDCNGDAQEFTAPFDQAGLICARPTPSIAGGVVTLTGTCATTTTSTSTTTTTTTCADCYTYYIENYDLGQTLTYQYLDCSGSMSYDNVVLPDTTTPDFCACSGSVQRQGGSLSYDIVFVWAGCGPEPTTTSTTTTTTTIDPTGCYEYELECLNPGGCNVSYTDCDGNPQSYSLPYEAVGLQCARPTPTMTGGTVTLTGPCTTTTTSTSTTTTSTTLPPTTTTSTTTSTTTVDPYYYYFAQPCGGGSTVYFRSLTIYNPGESVQIAGYGLTCYEVGSEGAPTNTNDVINTYIDCDACNPPTTTTTSTSTTTSTTTLSTTYYYLRYCDSGNQVFCGGNLQTLSDQVGNWSIGNSFYNTCVSACTYLDTVAPQGSISGNVDGQTVTRYNSCAGCTPPTTTTTTSAPTTTSTSTTSTTAAPTTTSTSTTTTTTTQTPNAYIAERNDGGDLGFVGPYGGYSPGDEVTVNDGSGQCWTLGAAVYSGTIDYLITGACPPPTTTSTTTTTTTLANCNQFFSSTSGYSTSAAACSATAPTRRRHDGSGFEPTIGDTVYSNVDCSSTFNGGGNWYKTGDGAAIQIGPTGIVVDEVFC